MKEITTLAIDLAKRVFQLYGVDIHGAVVLQRRVSRAQLLAVVAQIPRCRVVMEACGGAHYWAREIRTGSRYRIGRTEPLGVDGGFRTRSCRLPRLGADLQIRIS
jgi:hypothetical protein